ncbi:MAG: ThuA domain-containing protein [Terriglobia bacterium]
MGLRMLPQKPGLFIFLFMGALLCSLPLKSAGVVYKGTKGPGVGKHIVLVAGDDEYHSEEEFPQLAKILATRHGFTCTVLFSINPADGTIDPHATRNIPGLEALQNADLLIIFTRFRDLPDDQMKYLVDYIESGRPIIGIRTATHAFDLKTSKTYARYSWNSQIYGWEGGFGRRVFGTTWVAHHAHHGHQSTRGIIAKGEEHNPILRGIKNGAIWVPTDVYAIQMLPGTAQPLILGEVLTGMHPNDPPVQGNLNDPMIPVAWTNRFTGTQGKTARVFATTMGAADDFENEALRRLLVNATYWTLGLKVPRKADVRLVGEYHPHSFLSREYTHGVKPSDLAN